MGALTADWTVADVRYSVLRGPIESTAMRSRIEEGLRSAMPSFGVRDYFREKQQLFDDCSLTILATSGTAGTVAGLLCAKPVGVESATVLFIQTMLLGERLHRSSALLRMWRALFQALVEDGSWHPDAIAFKSYNPQSYAALHAFRHVPGVALYPALDRPAAAVRPSAEAIAAALAPGHPFDPSTGAIKDAAGDGPSRFYRDFPLCAKAGINDHFRKNLTPRDRMLCALYIGHDEAGQCLLSAMGVRSPAYA